MSGHNDTGLKAFSSRRYQIRLRSVSKYLGLMNMIPVERTCTATLNIC